MKRLGLIVLLAVMSAHGQILNPILFGGGGVGVLKPGVLVFTSNTTIAAGATQYISIGQVPNNTEASVSIGSPLSGTARDFECYSTSSSVKDVPCTLFISTVASDATCTVLGTASATKCHHTGGTATIAQGNTLSVKIGPVPAGANSVTYGAMVRVTGTTSTALPMMSLNSTTGSPLLHAQNVNGSTTIANDRTTAVIGGSMAGVWGRASFATSSTTATFIGGAGGATNMIACVFSAGVCSNTTPSGTLTVADLISVSTADATNASSYGEWYSVTGAGAVVLPVSAGAGIVASSTGFFGHYQVSAGTESAVRFGSPVTGTVTAMAVEINAAGVSTESVTLNVDGVATPVACTWSTTARFCYATGFSKAITYYNGTTGNQLSFAGFVPVGAATTTFNVFLRVESAN